LTITGDTVKGSKPSTIQVYKKLVRKWDTRTWDRYEI